MPNIQMCISEYKFKLVTEIAVCLELPVVNRDVCDVAKTSLNMFSSAAFKLLQM